MKTSLGIWALGSMVTRFVPGGYQPQWAGETTAERVRRAIDGLGDLIDGYEFHYPQELNADNRDAVRGGTRRARRVLRWRPASTSIRASGRGGLVSPDAATRGEAVSERSTPSTSRASSAPTSSSGRGSRATTTRSRRRTRRAGRGSSTASAKPPNAAWTTGSHSSSSTRTPSRQ